MFNTSRTTINVAVLLDPPAAMPCAVDPKSTDKTCPLPGFAIEIAKLVCQTLKYDCKFIPSGTSVYGQQVDGQWQGLLGLLSNETPAYDTAPPRLTPTFERLQAVDFSAPYYHENYLLFTRQPRVLANSETLDLLAAFRWEVWFSAVGLLLFVVCHFLSHPSDKRRTDRLIGFVLRGRIRHLRFHSKYLLSIIILMAFSILTAAYTGYLFSNRVAKREEPPFTDFDTFVDCVESRRCALATKTASFGYMVQFIEAGTSDGFKRLKKAVLGPSARNPLLQWPLDELLWRVR